LTVGVATAVFILVSAGGTSLLPKTFQTRVLQAITSGDINEAGTFLSRADLMKEAISVISDKGIFFLGLGADQFREISVQTAPVHNLYLLLWVEGGVTSLVGWLLFTLAGLLIWLALWRANGPRPALAAQAAVMAVILSIAMFNAHMYARYFLVPILLVHGISLSHLRRLSSASR
jgi:O-antigen ligase